MADNLGYGDIGPFGSRLHRTPNLDRMAREGRRLTSFYSASGVHAEPGGLDDRLLSAPRGSRLDV